SFVAALNKYPGLTNVYSSLHFDAQQYSIHVDRALATQSGVSMQDISDTVGTMLGGKHTTDVSSGQKSYSVLLQMQQSDLAKFNLLDKLYVRSSSGPGAGTLIPLSSLVKLTPIIGQSSLTHFNRMRSATVSAQLAGGVVESQAIAKVTAIAAEALPAGFSTAFSGKSQQYLQSSGTMLGVVGLAFVFIYLVLSAQFRSFVDPFAILLAVPLSMVGAAFMLWVVGGTLNLYSEVGMVTLIGLISKHGILITQFTNQKLEEGLDLLNAQLEAASIRLRPILMTTAAMVFGTLPLALATGPGSAGRREIGAVLVGGLLLGTFFSLFVVPVAYSYLSVLKPKKTKLPESETAVE
ncbi:MAG: efflux RND transporter permease subunit, partial [Candidatus Thioglobus sp.]